MLMAVGAFILIPLLSWLLARSFHWGVTWQLMLNYSNLGFMGFPVVSGLYGEKAVFYAAIILMIFNVHVFTAGVMMLQRENAVVCSVNDTCAPKTNSAAAQEANMTETQKNCAGVQNTKRSIILETLHSLCNPGILASGVALAIVLFGIPVPSTVSNIVSSLGAVTTPLALVVIGSQLAQVNLLKCLSRPELYLMSMFKLIVYPAVVYLVFSVVAGTGIVTQIIAILMGLPVAGNVTMLCSEYDGDVSLAASGTCVSTLLSIITIPVMVWFIG
jgi:hypothetical protein